MSEDNYADLKNLVKEQSKTIAVLNEQLAAKAKPEIPHVQVSGNDGHLTGVDLRDIAEGRVIVELIKPEAVELKDGEVSKNDQGGLNSNIEAIAAGKVSVR